MVQKKLIFEYKNYRDYLRDRFNELKSSDSKFSFRYFSKQAGFKSQSVLKQVINGEINIAVKSIEKYVKALKLNRDEAFYFSHLVQMNQAKTQDDLTFHAQELLKSKKFKDLFPLSLQQLNYYKNWYYIPIRELVGLKGFREDSQWIANQITPSIKAAEVHQAIQDLVALGLLIRDPTGNLRQAQQDVSTGDSVISELVRNYHREMIKKAQEAINLFEREERDISAVAISVSTRDLEKIKTMIRQFRKDIIKVAGQADERNQIYQMNIQFFPLTKKTDGDPS